jgi:uncharacterized protein YcbK (DUF882 family)
MTLKPQRQVVTRRAVLAGTGAAVMATAMPAVAASRPDRLSLQNLHTNETLDVVFRNGVRYDRKALAALDHILRDWRQDEILPIDPKLYDMMAAIAARIGQPPRYGIISGYRSPKTNEMLRQNGGGAAKRSLHMVGQAIDLRLDGTRLSTLRSAAIELGEGGVGLYSRSGFVHIDTGEVRSWGS